MEKVYCKNCKYNGDWFSNRMNYDSHKGWQWCEYKKYIKTNREHSKYVNVKYNKDEIDSSSYPVFKIERNKDGQCKYYENKKKWWKFW